MDETTATVLRFGCFELDLEQQELRKRGARVRLQAQPLKVLALLAARSGELISRREIRRHVWGTETFVDFDQGINVCIRQIRHALGDSAGSPRFVETVPRRGYRFLAPVGSPAEGGEVAAPVAARPVAARPVAARPVAARPVAARPAPFFRPWLLATAVVLLAGTALAVGAWMRGREASAPGRPAEAFVPAGSPAGSGPAKLLVVLPFRDLSAGPAQEYLGDGLTEELITELARRYGGRLGVIARTTAMKYRRTEQSAGEIAAELGAAYVLEGSVRRAGDRVRVTAQLVRAADEVHLWAGNYDRELADVLELESEVAGKIGQALALSLQLVAPEHPPEAAAADPRVLEAYLEGQHHLHRRRPSGFPAREDLERARNRLEEAVRLDPAFAPAYVDLAAAYRSLLGSHLGARRAREALAKALALDDSLARAHRRLAMLRLYYDWDLEGARAAFERAIELNPGYAEAYHDFAAYYSATGRHEEAVSMVERALRLDPRSPGVASDVGWYFYFGRRHREAVERCRRTLEMEPGYFWAEECILLAATAAGDLETAISNGRRRMREQGAAEEHLRALEAGDPGRALERFWRWRLARLEAAVQERPERAAPLAAPLATAHIALGETEAALAALELAAEERSGWILPFLPVHPLFDPLRPDPRFQALVARVTTGVTDARTGSGSPP